MTRDEIVAVLTCLDAGAKVRFRPDGRAQVLASALMAGPALDELLTAVPDAQVAFGFEAPLWLDKLDAMATSGPTGPSYELDDLEDATWKPGRKPEGWGTLP